MKAVLKRLILGIVHVLDHFHIGRYFCARVIDEALKREQTVSHGGITLRFCTANAVNAYRADTFSTKEPETLDWIDRIPAGSVLWDIGANVGIYTCYAAAKGLRVIAFEPSPFNIEFLARNLFLNRQTDRVTVIPLPLSDARAVSALHMSHVDWGSSLSTFGQSYGHDGKPLNEVFRYGTLGISMMDAIGLGLPLPDYIKMDVDGIEHLILKGGESVLHKVRGLLVEIDDNFVEQSEACTSLLNRTGMTLVEKRRGKTDGTPQERTFNQIWVRDTHVIRQLDTAQLSARCES